MSKLKFIIPAIVLVALVSGTAYAAQAAKPGDTLFPVKKATETIRVSLAASETDRVNLQNKFAQERLDELNEIDNENQQGAQTQANADAQTQAKTEVSSAITTLTQVQADLTAKGNTTAAAAIGDTIARLQKKLSDDDATETTEQHGGQNDHGGNGNDNSGPGNQNSNQNSNSNGNGHGNDDQQCTTVNNSTSNNCENEQNDTNGNDNNTEHSGKTNVSGQTQVNGTSGGGLHFDDGTGAEIGD